MTLEQMAYLAEIVGVILIVASLIYVGRQLRQNTEMMRAESRNMIQHGHQQEILALMDYPDVWRAFSGEELDDESVRLNQWLIAALRSREHEWFQYQSGALDKLAWDAFSKAIPLILSSERAQVWWIAARPIFDDGFAAKVDELLGDAKMSVVNENLASAIEGTGAAGKS